MQQLVLPRQPRKATNWIRRVNRCYSCFRGLAEHTFPVGMGNRKLIRRCSARLHILSWQLLIESRVRRYFYECSATHTTFANRRPASPACRAADGPGELSHSAGARSDHVGLDSNYPDDEQLRARARIDTGNHGRTLELYPELGEFLVLKRLGSG
jgi:hypothetical protein